MKSRVIIFNRIVTFIRQTAVTIREDRLSVYAAQASFFVIISAVPFISILIALVGIFLPEIPSDFAVRFPLSERILSFIIDELRGAPNVSLLSLSAVTTLWTASRGIAAIRAGIETVYRAEKNQGYVKLRLRSLISTLVFIVMIVAVVAIILFGDFLAVSIIGGWFEDVFLNMHTPIFIAVMTVIFTTFYAHIAKRSNYVRHSVILHVPGALFSSFGWIIFSFFYSLYISHFPNAATIYGSLAAICLIMLWLYFCMIILLLGAEVNKLWFCGLKQFRFPNTNKRR